MENEIRIPSLTVTECRTSTIEGDHLKDKIYSYLVNFKGHTTADSIKNQLQALQVYEEHPSTRSKYEIEYSAYVEIVPYEMVYKALNDLVDDCLVGRKEESYRISDSVAEYKCTLYWALNPHEIAASKLRK